MSVPSQQTAVAEADSDEQDLEMDFNKLRSISSDGAMQETILEFLASSIKLLDDLRQAIWQGDDAERRKVALKLHSSCSVLGANKLQDLSMRVRMLEDNQIEQGKVLFDELKIAFHSLRKLLRKHTDGVFP